VQNDGADIVAFSCEFEVVLCIVCDAEKFAAY